MSGCPTSEAAKSFTIGFYQQEECGGPVLEDAVAHHNKEGPKNDIFWLFIYVIDASHRPIKFWHTYYYYYIIPNTPHTLG